MGALDPINHIVGEDAQPQVRGLVEELIVCAKAFETVHKANKVIEFKSKGSSDLKAIVGIMAEVNKFSNELLKNTKVLTSATERLTTMMEKAAAAQSALASGANNTATTQQTTNTQAQTSAFQQLVAQYNAAKQVAQDYALTLGLEADETKQAAAAAVTLANQIKEVNALTAAERGSASGGAGATATQAQVSAYDQLVQKYNATKSAAQDYAATLGLEAKETVQASQAAAVLANQLREINAVTSGAKTPTAAVVPTDRSTEIAQLKALVDANNSAIQVYTAEAQSKSLLAATTQDVTQRQALEAETLQALQNIKNAELSTDKALAAANKDVAASVKEQMREELGLIAAKEALERETNKKVAALEKEQNAYNILSSEYRESAAEAKRLGAEYILLEREGKTSADQLLKLKEAHEAAQTAALNQQKALVTLDVGVGQHGRTVGAYKNELAGLQNSFNQITRELPALAINTNTFLLAISNNIPMLFDEVKKVVEQQKIARIASEAAASAVTKAEIKAAEAQAISARMADNVAKAEAKLIAARNISTGSTQAERIAEQELIEARAIAAGAADAEAKATARLVAARAAANTQAPANVSALTMLTKSVFSLNTLLSLSVAALTLFGGRIIEWISQLGGAEKANKAYRKELEETTKAVAKDIGQLYMLQQALNDSSVSLATRNKLIQDAKYAFPGYFDTLTAEGTEIAKTNKLIEQQIALRIQQAEQKALTNTVTNATEELVKAQEKLNEKVTFWQKSGAFIKDFFASWIGQSKEMSLEQQVLQGRLKDVKEAQDGVKSSINNVLDPMRQQNEAIREKIKDLKDEAASIRETSFVESVWIRNSNGALEERLKTTYKLTEADKQHKAVIESKIAVYESLIVANNALRSSMEFLRVATGNQISADDLALLKQKNNTLALKENSKEWVKSKQDEVDKQLVVNKAKLKNEFGFIEGALLQNETYQAKLKNLELEAARDREKISESADKKNKPKKTPRGFDSTTGEIKASEDYNKAIADLEKQRLTTSMANNKAIYDDDTLTLQERLDAYDAYVADRIQIQQIDANTEYNNVRAKLNKIADIEKIADSKRTPAQKSLLLDKAALLAQEETIVQKNELAKQEIIAGSTKEQLRITEEDTRNKMKVLEDGFSSIQQRYKKQTNAELRALNEKYNKGLIGDKAYHRQRNEIEVKASEKMYDEQIYFLDAQYQAIINSDLPDAVKEMFEEMYAKIPKPRRAQDSKSILEYLGFSEKSIEEQKQEIAKQIEGLYNTLFAAIDNQRNNHYAKEFDLLDREKEMIERNAEIEKNRIESTILNEDEKNKELKRLEGDKLAAEAANAQKRKMLQREQAQREKRDAIFQASLNAGVAISKVFAGMGTDPLAVPLAIAQAALIAAQTAANIAMISSRPIPEYWQGTDFHPGGPALVSEKGPELITLPDGGSFLSPDKPTYYDLPRGTKVTSNDDLAREAHRQAMREAAALSTVSPDDYAGLLVMNFERGLSQLGDQVEGAIKKIPVNNFNLKNGELTKSVSNGGTKIRYVGPVV